MRVAVDVRPLQFDAYRERGTGRFLSSLLPALRRLNADAQLLLIYAADRPPPAVFPPECNWEFVPLKLPFSVPELPATSPHADPDLEFQFDSAMEAFLAEQRVDLFHNPYPFAWEFYVPRRLHAVRSVVTILDVIPLVYRQEYLEPFGHKLKESFADRLGAAVYAQRVQTISATSARDIVRFAGIPAEKVDIIYPGVGRDFYPLDPEEGAEERRRLGLTSRYVFSLLGFHHSKNLRRTIQAFGRLPATVRRELCLVILSRLSAEQRRTVESWIAAEGLTGAVHLLEGASHRALLALYSGASAVLHAALYEGFGLPVLEAMACAAPVVASDISVLREIGGEAVLYVDPSDPDAIAAGLARVLEDRPLQERMRAAGLQRAQLFSWERAAQALLRSYQAALAGPRSSTGASAPVFLPSATRRLRLSFWSPFNPKLSGISDYSESLVAALRRYADVDCYVEGYQPSNRPLADTLPFYDARAYPQISAARPYDLDLYQIGNNALHRYIYRQALQRPGIITLHDVVLYYLIYHTLVKDGDTSAFWAEVAYSEGPAVAERARREYLRGRINDYELALHRRIVEASLGTIVHSRWAAERIAPVAVGPVQVIPMGCTVFPPDDGRFARVARALLGWPVDGLVIGVFGIMHRVKRVETVVRVYRRLRREFPQIALVLMGPVDPTAWPLVNELQQHPDAALAEGIHVYPAYASAEVLLTAMLAVDMGVNLRNPTAGETSATLHTMLGMGKPVIVSDIGTYREYPDLCCPKVPTDEGEEQGLYDALRQLIASPEALRRAAAAAWAYSKPNSWDRSAQRYLAFVETVLTRRTKA